MVQEEKKIRLKELKKKSVSNCNKKGQKEFLLLSFLFTEKNKSIGI